MWETVVWDREKGLGILDTGVTYTAGDHTHILVPFTVWCGDSKSGALCAMYVSHSY